ncbi:choline/glycine/proline betaine transport protein [Cellulomonas hominis]|uniref:Choline/glycine/proline betaine transport protein n=1 Tax=Cellulomonas hominis TaxID=156981 RepID=A0A7W8SH15_9CELL|nr:BCCT family transporter [Cellulomonas hominis]MBB5474868.1 choline/glycine/proline betaine transport protein [Cellulomonas hominis]
MTTTETDRPAVGGRGPWGTSRPVFWGSVAVVVLVAGLTIAFPETAGEVIGRIQTDVVSAFGWYYVLLVAGFVAFALWVGLGRWGDITLGQDDDVPQYRLTTWFAMLFATGMGIGMVFWGVAEPLSHYADPKPAVTGTPEELAQAAMSQTYLHWGVSAWAIYVVVGLALAYTVHRKGRPVSIRWALEPLLGARVRGRLGDGIDITAVVGTVFGIATSLGLGVLQITAGLEHVGIARSSTVLQVVVIVGVTGLATFSVVSGLDRGLKWLSNINVVFAGVLLLAVLALGPTLFLLREFVQSLGVYLASVVPMMFNVSAYAGAEGEAWQASWTTFYWGWWISWSPFVGVFIARISRGRTVREFVGGVLLVPTLVCFLWFSVLGGSALHTELFGGGGLVGPGGEVVPENALFDLLAGLPGGAVLSVGAIVLVALFFITSADSGALVVSMLSAGGDPEPRTPLRVLWAALGGVLAIALLLAGGLTALQTAAILIALPFSVVMIGMVVSTSRALHAEHTAFLRAEKRQVRAQLAAHVGARVEAQVQASVARHVDERLGREPGGSRPPQPPRPGVRRRRTD